MVNCRKTCIKMESSKETGCQAQEGPILCINNCGFFGSANTMNMCSKCHKDIIVKQQQAKLSGPGPGPVFELKPTSSQPSSDLGDGPKSEGPNRCATCRKRIGLTGFSCRCGNLFCSIHRYSDKHDCPFDYRAAGQDAIAKANPLVKAEKIDKI